MRSTPFGRKESAGREDAHARLLDQVVRQAGRCQSFVEEGQEEPVALKKLDKEALAKLAKNEGENLLLVNVWGTYCGPCLVELPELVNINRMFRQRKFQMVTISLDDPTEEKAALKALQDKYVSSTNYLSTMENRDRFADLLDKEWRGPLPHTVLIAPGGKVVYRKNGQLNALELRGAIVDYLGRTYASKSK
jgi:thiol-disulfide isomerase/thioredoxin